MTSKPFIPYTTSLYPFEQARARIGEAAYRRSILFSYVIPVLAAELAPPPSLRAHLLSSTTLNRSLF